MIDVKYLKKNISPAFYEVHENIATDKYTHYRLCGGRGSTKSSFISIEIIYGIMKNPDTNAVVIRKVGAYLKDSVFAQLEWAIDVLGVGEMWKFKLSPLEMVYTETGQKILFRGADEPKKLKSTKLSKGYIRYIWYEELDEFNGSEEIRNYKLKIVIVMRFITTILFLYTFFTRFLPKKNKFTHYSIRLTHVPLLSGTGANMCSM